MDIRQPPPLYVHMATNQNNSWTLEADDQLREMLLGGKSVLAIRLG
jgi:hypothetical protein